MKKLLLVALSTFAVSAHAWEPEFYAGASLSSWGFNFQTLGKGIHLQAIELSAGSVLLPYISVETRIGTGITEGQGTTVKAVGQTIVTDTYKAKLDYSASAYFRPFIANETATLYGLLGAANVKIRRNGLGFEETGMSYGAGINFTTSPHTQFVAEWKRLINGEEFDMSGATVGFTYTF